MVGSPHLTYGPFLEISSVKRRKRVNTILPPSPVRPKRLLSIDGGGFGRIGSREALILIEKQLDNITGQQLPLCDRFD